MSFVWVDAWQQQCCGERFRVGAKVEWDVRQVVDDAWVVDLLGPDWSGMVAFAEEHHGFSEGETQRLTGLVGSIAVVSYDLEPVPTAYRNYQAKPGTGRLRQVTVADPWEPEPPESEWTTTSFGGWIVELA